LLASTLRTYAGSVSSQMTERSWGALVTVLWGVNALGKTGLAVFTSNNTCLVYLWLVLCWNLFCRCYRSAKTEDFILLGVASGGLAQVYETHFGLFWLASITTLAIRHKHASNAWRAWTGCIILAAALALDSGRTDHRVGPSQELFLNRRAKPSPTGSASLSKTQLLSTLGGSWRNPTNFDGLSIYSDVQTVSGCRRPSCSSGRKLRTPLVLDCSPHALAPSLSLSLHPGVVLEA
jgi:hypothetical protein